MVVTDVLKSVKVDDYINSHISHIIDEVVHSERDRNLLKRRYIDGIHLEPLSEEFQLSVTQTKRIIKKYSYKLFKD